MAKKTELQSDTPPKGKTYEMIGTQPIQIPGGVISQGSGEFTAELPKETEDFLIVIGAIRRKEQ